MIRKLEICLSIIILFSLTLRSQNISYSFITAGHAYGSHNGDNIGLHPPFLNALNNGFDTTVHFFVFTGDIVNHSNEESWQQFELEMANFAMPYYCSMGNHDNNEVAHDFYNQKYGNHYYAYEYKRDRHIVLNSTEQDRGISAAQLEFLETQLSLESEVNNVFIYFHEVIWNSHEKYKDTRSNSRSRYDKVKDISNYWTEVHPLLEKYNDRKIILISGDVAGNPDAIPAFYDKWEHVTLISSGMGEVADENYLQVDVLDDGSVQYKLIPLRDEDEPKELEWYSIPEAPSSIAGETNISDFSSIYTYEVNEIENADSYEWELPEFVSGISTSNAIEVQFENGFTSGEIKVKAVHDGYGSSEAASLEISSVVSNGINKTLPAVNVYFKTNRLFIENGDFSSLQIFDSNGKQVFSGQITQEPSNATVINLTSNDEGIYIVRLIGSEGIISKKILVN